ncbi:GvpL/GvpF family gas vesicle protein [Bacillus sp. H-16]|uniref:GvpL/GvpF family gas vesicle protein n=1 Tax=Alteribacter salitolerans TaxID=2912333 RepID=UPI001965EBD1|nr:GvpL/GvpF family gas vesicle protein [Alteribacter salitolerans]MBM7095650.1 GvpL/GvpF family gas vesicle protein [Alteribacter salitolerans]
MSKEGVYMFGAIETEEAQTFEKVKLAGEHRRVYTIPYKGLSMVVTNAPVQIYEPSRQNLKAHQDTVAAVMKQFTIIPMSFGNVLESEKDVKILLTKLSPQFNEIFPRIRGKMEVGLKLIGKKEWIENSAQNEPAMKKLQTNVKGKNAEAGYYDRIKLGEAARNFMTKLQMTFDQEVFQPLAEVADAAKNNEAISERMLINAAFLIDKEKEAEFDALVNEFHEEWGDRVDFKYTGPWPAYNFINLKIKADAS